ncbi:site-specific DNA-methyltransferase [Citromicrobium bathyomarinum]
MTTENSNSAIPKITRDDEEAGSGDLARENVERLKALFPQIVADGKIDFDVLRQLLGDEVEDGEERYGLNWKGKRRARAFAMTPSLGTLLPAPEDSVDWDATQNIIIEGDNLEVLKLLRRSYAGKVKLIYIDPPYNTGKDFVYPDNYANPMGSYLKYSGQTDEGGSSLTSNKEGSGRFHTDWLSMMLPRLEIAKELLADDGAIVISLDDTEATNTRAMLDDVFGAENFVELVSWKNKYGSGALTKGFASVHEHILVYSKNGVRTFAAPLTDEQRAAYKKKDEKFDIRGGYITQPLATKSKDDRPNLVYPLIHDGEEIWPNKQWIWEKERLQQAYDNDEVVLNKKKGKWSVRVKQYLNDEDGVERLGKPLSLMNGPFNQEGTKDIEKLEMNDAFSFPKPVSLIQYFASMVINDNANSDGIYLDFFAGSGTTGQAVMRQNAEDGGTRRFVLVQFPEPLDEKKKEQKKAAKFCDGLGAPRNIAELTKERLRRAGKQIGHEYPEADVDVGFRVYKLATSNLKLWQPDPDNLEASILDAVDNVLPDRSEDDLLVELLLKTGIDLTMPEEKREIAGQAVHALGGGALMVCLGNIADEQAEELGQGMADWVDELDPAQTTVYFKDSGIGSDGNRAATKANLAAILRQRLGDRIAKIASI